MNRLSVYSKERLFGKLNSGAGVQQITKPESPALDALDNTSEEKPATGHTCNGRCADPAIKGLEQLIVKLDEMEKRQALDRQLIDTALNKVERLLEAPKPVETKLALPPHNFKQLLVTAQSYGRIVSMLAGSALALLDSLDVSTRDTERNVQATSDGMLDIGKLLAVLGQLTGESARPVETTLSLPKDALEKWLNKAQTYGKILNIVAGAILMVFDEVFDSAKASGNHEALSLQGGQQLDLQSVLAVATRLIEDLSSNVDKDS